MKLVEYIKNNNNYRRVTDPKPNEIPKKYVIDSLATDNEGDEMLYSANLEDLSLVMQVVERYGEENNQPINTYPATMKLEGLHLCSVKRGGKLYAFFTQQAKRNQTSSTNETTLRVGCEPFSRKPFF